MDLGLEGATELYERDRDWHPTKRMGTAGEVARMVAFLANPAASWVMAPPFESTARSPGV